MLSSREYGHRVGLFRIVPLLERYGLAPTIAMDALTAERYPFIVDYCLNRGLEIIGHGISATQIITSEMSVSRERQYVSESLQRLSTATGQEVRGWMSPEYSESPATPQILAENDVEYVCDWANDEQPYRMSGLAGDLISIPITLDCDDAYALGTMSLSLTSYSSRIVTTCKRLVEDGRTIARSFVLVLRPWLIGQPFRVSALEEALEQTQGWPGVVSGSAGDIAKWYVAGGAHARAEGA